MCTFPKNSDPNSNMDNIPFQTLEDFLFNSTSDDEDDEYYVERYGINAELVKEESKLESKIINIIVSGNGDSLMPNSGQAVIVSNHSVCVGFKDEENGYCQVWEWHCHIMIYDIEHGSSLGYIYGTYFQRFMPNPPVAAQEN